MILATYSRNGVQVITTRASKAKTKKRLSLHIWLFLILIITGMVPVMIFNQVLFHSYMNSVLDRSMKSMEEQAKILSDQLSLSGYMEGGGVNLVNNALLDQMADTWYGRIRIVDSDFVVIKDTYDQDEGMICVDSGVLKAFSGSYTEILDQDAHTLCFVEPITAGDSEGKILGAIIVNAVTTNTEQPITDMQETAWMIQMVFFCILLLIDATLLYFLLKPLKTLALSIRNVAEGSKNSRVDVHTYAETERISESFNVTWQRMQTLDESRQEFVSNVAHELKTPITSVRVLADSLTSMGEAPVELYQEFMVDISEELDRESKIIDDLLSLSRLEKNADSLHLERLNINEMMELILKRLLPIANRRDIDLKFESFRPVTADIDEVKLTLAITNLVENAIKYNKDGGWVKVSLNADYQYFFIKVSDSGCGIPEDALEHIFERFYRVDKARSRDTGGTGLGLAISKTIVAMHHGAIRAYSKLGEGTTFVVRIPLKYVDEEV